ncbi:hypothetical protein [Methylocystis bryophila]|uniref:Uncharacterized protein n=1 Tax=Methylocystis bryophila TaxID=655015 RepID=A0A1W6MSU8_9HYPH|nr:hypothetical protein [Methylocystis bryophila]ARN80680.1 hypothetical protein B1812_05885 [Methylocystis bryophila]BDV40746.1 hypothetical protein DSM21852_39990 [Methylocystis bryophila]
MNRLEKRLQTLEDRFPRNPFEALTDSEVFALVVQCRADATGEAVTDEALATVRLTRAGFEETMAALPADTIDRIADWAEQQERTG